jgi:hypothetical protein
MADGVHPTCMATHCAVVQVVVAVLTLQLLTERVVLCGSAFIGSGLPLCCRCSCIDRLVCLTHTPTNTLVSHAVDLVA